MPPEVERLAAKYMRDPKRVDMSEDRIDSSETIEQFAVTVDPDRKFALLTRLLLQERPRQASFPDLRQRSKPGSQVSFSWASEFIHKLLAGVRSRLRILRTVRNSI
jgi:superfamily II DNA/RNA helicase